MEMEVIINILLIATICVIVTDCTDFFEYVKHWIWKFAFNNSKPYRNFEIKILQCSLCQTWWCSLIYLIFSHNITLYYIAFALFAAYMTPVINTTLIFIKELFAFIFERLFHLIDNQSIK